jgi:cation diffusion facilitator family transporter
VFVAAYEARRGRALGSAFLMADAAHTASDVGVTVGVLASMGLARAGIDWADPVAALLVTVMIARVAWRVLVVNVDVLLDAASLPAKDVREVVLAVEGVRGCHRVRSRGVESAYQVDLHVLVDGEQALAEAHEISHRVEAALKARFAGVVDVVIHVEPDGDEEEDL